MMGGSNPEPAFDLLFELADSNGGHAINDSTAISISKEKIAT
jgi:hypothetical protein